MIISTLHVHTHVHALFLMTICCCILYTYIYMCNNNNSNYYYYYYVYLKVCQHLGCLSICAVHKQNFQVMPFIQGPLVISMKYYTSALSIKSGQQPNRSLTMQ